MFCAITEPTGPKKGGQVWESKQMMGQPDKSQQGWEEWGMAGGRGEWGVIESFRMVKTSKVSPPVTQHCQIHHKTMATDEAGLWEEEEGAPPCFGPSEPPAWFGCKVAQQP